MKSLLDTASRLLDLKRPADAARSAREALAADPSLPRGWLLLSLAHTAMNEPHEALDAANRAVSLNPQEAALHRRASACLLALGLGQQALVAARTSLSLDPHNAKAHETLALALTPQRRSPWATAHGHGLAELREAAHHADAAIALAPGSELTHFVAGYVAAMAGRPQEARQHYERALAINPLMATAQNNLALLDLQSGQSRSAVAGFLGAARIDPRWAQPLRNVKAALYGQLLLLHALSAVVYVLFAVAARPANQLTALSRSVAACVVLVAYLVGAVVTWRRAAPPLRLVAHQMVSTWHRLWLVAMLDLFVVGCFFAGAATSSGGAGGVYLKGFVAMPFIVLLLARRRLP